jgi:hypothetical protein
MVLMFPKWHIRQAFRTLNISADYLKLILAIRQANMTDKKIISL